MVSISPSLNQTQLTPQVQIPIRPQDAMSASPALTPSPSVSLTLHPTSTPGLILKAQPPTSPPTPARAPCDIVLAIDVSASMSAPAPVPGGASEPNYGFSVLDLTKHAALTILETLGDEDRLGIVAFTDKVTVLRGLEVVDEGNKGRCREAILGMEPLSATNLWGAIVKGLELFEGGPSGRNPALLVSSIVQCERWRWGWADGIGPHGRHAQPPVSAPGLRPQAPPA